MGLRIGVELPQTSGHPALETQLFTFGGGLHINEVASVELDVFRLGLASGEIGLMAGLRAEGRVGKYVGFAEAIALGAVGIVTAAVVIVYLAKNGGPAY